MLVQNIHNHICLRTFADLYEMLSASSEVGIRKQQYAKFLKAVCSGSTPEVVIDRIIDECWVNATGQAAKHAAEAEYVTPEMFTQLLTVFDVHTLLTVNI
jgi:hypothetical protein